MKIRIFALLMASLILCSSNTVYARSYNPVVESTFKSIKPRYVNIVHAISTLSIRGTRATLSANITTRNSVNTRVKMQLQKKSGATWSTVKTWNNSYIRKKFINFEKSYTVIKGGTYRITTVFTTGGESQTSYSSSVKA